MRPVWKPLRNRNPSPKQRLRKRPSLRVGEDPGRVGDQDKGGEKIDRRADPAALARDARRNNANVSHGLGAAGERREGGGLTPAGVLHRGEHRGGPGGGGERREGPRSGGPRPFDGMGEIELEKLVSDSLYLDNQAHAVVARMRDMDSGTKSQLRRLYNAVRRAVRALESERQHQFVMLRARLAYTIARHSLRSLDALERLLLQVTRRNDARGYERFKDLFEAIVAYNE